MIRIHLTPQSSNVVKLAYNDATHALQITYKSGVYVRFGVEPRDFEAMKKAESIGKFLAAHFKGLPNAVKLNPEKDVVWS